MTNSSPVKPHPIRGYLYIAAAGLLWGLTASLGKAVFTQRLVSAAQSPIDPLILSQTRTTISFLVLAPVLLLVRGRAALAISRKDFGRTLLLGTLGIAASNYFYYLAIEKTTVATAIVLQYTAPGWVLLYMLARHQQRPTLRRVGAVLMAVAGSALAIGVAGQGKIKLDAVGIAAALAAAFSFAFYNVYGHKLLETNERWKIITYTLLGAALFWLVVNPPWKIIAAHYSGEQWLFLAVFAMLSMLLPFSFYFAGLQYLAATRAIVTSCLEPVFAILIAAAFLGEGLGPLQVVGVVVVLAASIVVQLPEKSS
ncbi:MAG TPA: EamA family transporter [Terriglobales bacterium]|nr:EamA family transporter [Terriglobales bacterium]